jgi:hypothetical protein
MLSERSRFRVNFRPAQLPMGMMELAHLSTNEKH